MGSIQKTPLFFRSKPLFGLDVGKSSLKVVQIADQTHPKPKLVGYGIANFDTTAIVDGVVEKPEIIASAAHELFAKHLIGDITSRHVAMTIPAYRTFTRSIQLPPLRSNELAEAVRLEAEQYIPVPLKDLYLDYTTIAQSPAGQQVLAVAVPKTIVDSYLELSALMGLQTVLLETTMSAAARLFARDTQSDVPTILIDFGTVTSDISIYNHGLTTTSTVQGGGQSFNDAIEKELHVTTAEARIIKIKYGIGKSKRQAEIQAALDPTLQKITKEVKRLMRYHQEHAANEQPIKQIITLGGGANMPGLSEYFTSSLRLAVRALDPWQYITATGLQPPSASDRPMYATALGLSAAPPHEVFT